MVEGKRTTQHKEGHQQQAAVGCTSQRQRPPRPRQHPPRTSGLRPSTSRSLWEVDLCFILSGSVAKYLLDHGLHKKSQFTRRCSKALLRHSAEVSEFSGCDRFDSGGRHKARETTRAHPPRLGMGTAVCIVLRASHPTIGEGAGGGVRNRYSEQCLQATRSRSFL